jgi:asparagine synthase (glutamine-hydrolysing)
MLWLDNHTYLPGCLLVKMDIASMPCGLETRLPLLDHVVIEFCARLPVQHKVKDQVGKISVEESWRNVALLPTSCTGAERGFTPALVAWLRAPLREPLLVTQNALGRGTHGVTLC